MKTTPEEYDKKVSIISPKSKIVKNIFFAFLSGGTICTIGQILLNIYLNFGLEKKQANTWVTVTLIFLGGFLTSLKIYDNIAKYAGAGTILPVTGFANSMVSPAMEFKTEGHVLGLGAKMFLISGPVIVFSVVSSVIYGIFIYVFKLY
ncbi:MAG: stage V sporulation protein AC [Candidatus Paraimprobicoccus trichonymphae]|uniref:Stage V sporulation protein AC n=1 Tax=Candidatus Paraimprobicoccus trichonymphae TaxID=3033793 RepID=A0AA48KW64_9FIRM|nr:MAG: stage V sporulation protein AC [Candidatus Paraimprobicoccus trichonymphae]